MVDRLRRNGLRRSGCGDLRVQPGIRRGGVRIGEVRGLRHHHCAMVLQSQDVARHDGNRGKDSRRWRKPDAGSGRDRPVHNRFDSSDSPHITQQPDRRRIPGSLIREIHDLARNRRLALIFDETYRDFDSRAGPVHDLFADPDWPSTLIHLYSFSKAYRLTGHRVGAMLASERLLAEIEKFLDTVAICPNRIGQHAALFGIRNLSDWLEGQRTEILKRRSRIESGFSELDGWNLRGCGAYFAFVEHPFDLPSDRLVLKLLSDLSVLALPGTMFAPIGYEHADRQLRIAYANIDLEGIGDFFSRLDGYRPS